MSGAGPDGAASEREGTWPGEGATGNRHWHFVHKVPAVTKRGGSSHQTLIPASSMDEYMHSYILHNMSTAQESQFHQHRWPQ